MADNSLFEKLGQWIQRFLLLYLAVLAVQVLAACVVIASLAGTEGAELSSGHLQAAGFSLITMAYSGFVEFGAYVVAAILFLRLLYKAVQQAKGFATPYSYASAGWAVGYWFIPIVNLYRPFQAVQALFKACAAQAGGDGKPAAGEQLLNAWWALFLISNAAGWALARYDADLNSTAGVTTYSEYSIACNLLFIIGTVLFWQVVKRLVKAMGSTAKG